ncbi:hypothetical protein HOD38_05410 [archaeon]|jgi:hypothetical protein|nr:hypothetical protein [archaeon]MBT4397678.1 hypothetical protein [archaeon]MBT4441626.1 hypothetical protein [archaeon]
MGVRLYPLKNPQISAEEIKTLFLELNPEFLSPNQVAPKGERMYFGPYRIGIKDVNPRKSRFEVASDLKGLRAAIDVLMNFARKKKWRLELRSVNTAGHKILFLDFSKELGIGRMLAPSQFNELREFVKNHSQNCAIPE